MNEFSSIQNPNEDDYNSQQKEQKSKSQQAITASQSQIKVKSQVRANDQKRAEQIAKSKIESTFNNEFGKNTLEYDRIVEECEHLKFGAEWSDPEFPANETSLSLNFDNLPQATKDVWQQITWKRPQEFLDEDNIKLFDEIDPDDIKQGLLGDCYFLCALSALAEQDLLIQRLFHTKEKQQFGVYSIWLNINGEWININIDDNIPFRRDKPAFSRGQGDELWVLLLEKAYAKAYGSYEIIEGGNPSYALRDLTGAPTENIDNKTPDEFWKYLEENDNESNVLTCYTKTTNVREEENELGILSGHAYSILDHKNVRGDDNKYHRILKIRNPWGMKEWTGDWSDNSKMWNPVLRQRLNVEDKNDGTFWMSIQDFAKYFEGIGNCKVRDDYSYNSIKLNFKDMPIKLIQFKVKEFTHGFISVNQMDERMFAHSPQPYQYSACRMFILKKEQNQQYVYVGAIYDVNRNIFVESEFSPGEYIVVTQFFWEQDFIFDCTISSYSQKPIQFEYLEGADPIEFLKIAFKYIAIDSEDKIDVKTGKPIQKVGSYVKTESGWNYPLISKRYGVQFGSFYMYYKNGEISQVLCEDLTFKMNGYIPVEPYFDIEDDKNGKYNGQYELNIQVNVPSDREAVILFDCKGDRYSYNFSFRPSVYRSITNEAKVCLDKVEQNPNQLLKIDSTKFQTKKNISSFGRSQVIGQAIKNEQQSRINSQVAISNINHNSNGDGNNQQNTQIDNTYYMPEIEEECLEIFDDIIGNKITGWGLFINWVSFMMFPIFLLQAFAKNTQLDTMIAMSVINLLNAEMLTRTLLRQIINGIYFSLIVDIISMFIDRENHHLLTGQSLDKSLYTFSLVMIYIGMVYKIFVVFSYLHVYKNYLSVMPYIQQGFRRLRYWLRNLQLDSVTMANLKEQYKTVAQNQTNKSFTSIPLQNKQSANKSVDHITLEVIHN